MNLKILIEIKSINCKIFKLNKKDKIDQIDINYNKTEIKLWDTKNN